MIAVIKGNETVLTRLNNTLGLDLPPVWDQAIRQIVQDNQMLYEPWIESANSYEDLREKLRSRGYSNIPMGLSPLLNLGGYEKAPIANTSQCKVVRTMIRKKA